MPKQVQSKTEYKKAWRKKVHEERRFNKILNKYLKLKYTNIYEECCEFFKILNERNRAVKDLTKTTAFKKWARSQQPDSDDESIMLFTYRVNPGEEAVTPVSIEQISPNDEDNHDQGNNEQQQDQDHDQGNNEQQQTQDHDQGNNEQQQAHDHNEGNNIIDQIINELEINQELYNVLNEPQHDLADDEGIGLNLEDEIIDPFDFTLEVDF